MRIKIVSLSKRDRELDACFVGYDCLKLYKLLERI